MGQQSGRRMIRPGREGTMLRDHLLVRMVKENGGDERGASLPLFSSLSLVGWFWKRFHHDFRSRLLGGDAA